MRVLRFVGPLVISLAAVSVSNFLINASSGNPQAHGPVTAATSFTSAPSAPAASSGGGRFGGVVFTPPSSTTTTPPPVRHIPTPPVVTPHTPDTPTVFPLDVTTPRAGSRAQKLTPLSVDQVQAISGITEIRSFPSSEFLKGSQDFILVQKESDSDVIQRETPYLVNLVHGRVLASVRRPSELGMVHTELGDVAFHSNSDAFIDFAGDVLRVRNFDGMGQTIKVRINRGPSQGHAFAVAPGYELVVADHKLTRTELRPNDNIMRRGTQTFAGGFAGVSQYSGESELQHNAIVAQMVQRQNSDAKAHRILSDMSRMAAVLNQINGGDGFSRE